METRKLASIQRIKNLRPISGADKIEVAEILGWEVVVKKGEHQIGDLCVYCEIDSVLPDLPQFEFLRKNKFRIKTIRMRGQISQGIAFSLDSIPEMKEFFATGIGYYCDEGQDVTKLMNVAKYESPEEQEEELRKEQSINDKKWYNKLRYKYLYKWFPFLKPKKVSSNFPSFLRKTDELRIQSYPKVLEELKGKQVYLTEKLDGSSMTVFYNKKDFGVCSRARRVSPKDKNSKFYNHVKAIGLEKRLTEYCKRTKRNLAVQGELIGAGIQKNKYGLKGYDFRIFQIYDIDLQRYLGYYEFLTTCSVLNLEACPILGANGKADYSIGYEYLVFDLNTVEELLEFAKGNSYLRDDIPREGIVIRPVNETYSDELRGRLSIKAINNDFLEKFGG